MVQNNKQKSFCPPRILKLRGLQGEHLTGTIVDTFDCFIQLRQVLDRLTSQGLVGSGCPCDGLLKGIDLKKRVLIKDDCGQELTGTIIDVMDSFVQLRQVPERITNISCAKICMIRNLTLEESKALKVDLPPLLDFWIIGRLVEVEK